MKTVLLMLLIIGSCHCIAQSSTVLNITDGNALLTGCTLFLDFNKENTTDQFNAIETSGYIDGVLDAYPVAQLADQRKTAFDIPNGVTKSQKVRVIKAYLEKNPKILDVSASVLIIAAMADAFPATPTPSAIK